MVRLSVTENGAFQDPGLTIFMVGMIAASISMMGIVIFACAKSSTKRKNKNNPYNCGGDKTSAKTIVIGESKAQKTRATSAPVRSAGEILISAASTTAIVDIPSTDDVCNNDDGKDTRCHGGDTTISTGGDDGRKTTNDVSTDRTDNQYVSGDNNNNMGGGHTHASTNSTSGGGGHHHDNTSTGNTGGGHSSSGWSGGGWSNDHGGNSWGGGDHGGGFSGGSDTGGFSGGGW